MVASENFSDLHLVLMKVQRQTVITYDPEEYLWPHSVKVRDNLLT